MTQPVMLDMTSHVAKLMHALIKNTRVLYSPERTRIDSNALPRRLDFL
jgi:hypothetical protein